MSRQRIRTIKPELWHDEAVGSLSRDARLLLIGLITLADDEGRFRALPAALLGHIFPYDHDAPRRLGAWAAEIEATSTVVFYEVDDKPYGVFRHWRRHQRINRARVSVLPEPPDQQIVEDNRVADGSSNGHPPAADRTAGIQ
jgi:hypothetical protein